MWQLFLLDTRFVFLLNLFFKETLTHLSSWFKWWWKDQSLLQRGILLWMNIVIVIYTIICEHILLLVLLWMNIVIVRHISHGGSLWRNNGQKGGCVLLGKTPDFLLDLQIDEVLVANTMSGLLWWFSAPPRAMSVHLGWDGDDYGSMMHLCYKTPRSKYQHPNCK